jgi:hypothetical protein
MVGKKGVYRIGVYKLKDEHDGWWGFQSKTYSMRVYFQKGDKANPVDYLFSIFKRIVPGADVSKDCLEGFQFVEKTRGKASNVKPWFSVRDYEGDIVGIEPHRLPISVAKKCLAAMAREIKSDFPGAVVDGIKVA